MQTVEVQNVRKSFGDVDAVNDVSLSIKKGTVFGLLGPNGAGKTTLIRMIMNIIVPDSGKISIFGDSISKLANDAIGYLPEERGLYRKMKVVELLRFLSKLKLMERNKAKTQINYWLERMEISDWKKKKVEDLSKGMQQKLQFIGTILHEPKLLILDEPFGGLDPINTNLIKDILMELKEKGTTIIFSTHIMESAEKLCEEIFLINKGKRVLSGKLSEIKKSFGERNVILKYEGSNEFLSKSKQVKTYDNYGNYVEVQLTDNADTQKLLKEAMDSAKIHKFEIKEPSLNEIFIESVNGARDEK